MKLVQSNVHPGGFNEIEGLSIDNIADYYFSLDTQNGFLEHPQNIPLQANIASHVSIDFLKQTPAPGLGINFYSKQKFLLKQWLEVSILVKGKEHNFLGEVVQIKNLENHFMIGVWLNDDKQVQSLRDLQHYCHLENCIKEKHTDIDLSNTRWSEFLQTVFPTI